MSQPTATVLNQNAKVPLTTAACRRRERETLLSPLTSQTFRQSECGLSLVQLLGTLAVIALLASALLPAVIRSIDHAAWTKEVNDMSAISNALTLQIMRTYTIPDEVGWAAAVADWTARPASQITINPRRVTRQFVYDGGGWLNGQLPFTQSVTGTGANTPSSARILLISSIVTKPKLPNLTASLSTANFNSIWNAAQSTTPAFLTTQGWNGNPYDLVIQRVSLDTVFHRLIMTTRDNSTNAGYSINTSAYASVPTGASGINTYFLDGSVVRLATLLSGGGTTNEVRLTLTRDMSFTFEAGTWHWQLNGSGTSGATTAESFANEAARFISTTQIPGQHQGADPQGTLSAFYTFMFSYTLWANKCPHFQFSGNNGNQDADYQILNMLGQTGGGGVIDGATGSGSGGLLQ